MDSGQWTGPEPQSFLSTVLLSTVHSAPPIQPIQTAAQNPGRPEIADLHLQHAVVPARDQEEDDERGRGGQPDAGGVALAFLVLGPTLMKILFGGDHHYGRIGLVLVAVGMGFYLSAATLNQAALARGQAALSGGAWLVVAGLFVAWTLTPVIDDQLLRVELGYALATALLSILLLVIYRLGGQRR